MSVTSLSFTFVNTYAPPAAKSTAPAERCAPAEQVEKHSCGESRPASRQNRLVEAMMSALRELGFGAEPSQAAAPAAAGSSAAAASNAAVTTADESAAAAVAASAAATATSAATSTDSTDSAAATTEAAAEPAVTLESAVRQFAHELFSALRQVGRGESSDQGSDRNRVDGDGGRRHHHGHHGWRRESYGDMSQRLNALSQTFAAPAAVAAASAAPVSTSISITLTIQNGAAPAPAEAVTTNAAAGVSSETAETAEASESATAAETNEAVQTAPAAAASTTAQEVARNPLLDAFSQLFGALKPQAAQTDMADKLRSFLQTLAQSMRPESMNHGMPMPQVGSLVNVTA
jgi:hypothetical protein